MDLEQALERIEELENNIADLRDALHGALSLIDDIDNTVRNSATAKKSMENTLSRTT